MLSRGLRKGKKLIPPRRAGADNFTLFVSLCFGFHDDDYKVLRVLAFQNRYEIYVYSLNTDSWKFVKAEVNIEDGGSLEKFNVLPYPKARLVKGVAYFIQGNRIISYDLDDEKIRKIQLPGDMSSATHVIMEEYGESIALIGSNAQFYNTYNVWAIGYGVVMWVLKQSDNSNIWEKKFDIRGGGINKHRWILYPVVQAMGGFVNNNELVMRKWKIYGDKYLHREYFLFNVETGFQKQISRPREQARGEF
ncbi:hypothetical protein DCAR_0309897 [Daucus carota subsp. sativus]|uniref:F-box associated beta-propeller type 3 domain-containing protein n=1 Tax=Daucus carota subsp. sativus TaxID=79200 RepID=A0A165ZGG1_DAUCS|nr:hypothetical protein DCAR_0309897 [Daucus carota subsp. sativus]